jgi:hypothetical protein
MHELMKAIESAGKSDTPIPFAQGNQLNACGSPAGYCSPRSGFALLAQGFIICGEHPDQSNIALACLSPGREQFSFPAGKKQTGQQQTRE